MVTKFVYIAGDGTVDLDNALITRKELNALCEENWDIAAEQETQLTVNGKRVDCTEFRLKREQALVAPAAPERAAALPVPAGNDLARRYGAGQTADPGERMLVALEAQAQQTGHGSFLGPTKIGQVIPGLTIVPGEAVGMARDSGVHAANVGQPRNANPFPPGTRPYQLWDEGWATGSAHLDQSAGKDIEDYTDEERIAYDQGYHDWTDAVVREEAGEPPIEVFSRYQGGPLYLAWMRGAMDAGMGAK